MSQRSFADQSVIVAPHPYCGRFRVSHKFIKESDVYLCHDLQNNGREVVVKAEEIGSRRRSNLQKEWDFYKKLSKSSDFDIVLDYFVGISHRILVMEKRGLNFRQYYKKQIKAGLWTDRQLGKYAAQMIAGLQKCHSFGIIHLDPKPNNYVLDAKDDNRIYLIDFDCAKEYIDTNGRHIPFRHNIPFKEIFGNRVYISLNGHRCEEQSRRDDMIFLGYSLIWMARNGLPWNCKQCSDFSSLNQFYDYIREEKSRYSLEELSLNYDNKVSHNLVQYMKYCTELKFEEEPNYSYLMSLFDSKESVIREGCSL